MLSLTAINPWAVIVVWLIYLVVGALWYSPLMFAARWHKLTGVDIMKIPTRQANRIIGFVALSSLIQVIILAMVISSLDAKSAVDGLAIGLLLWGGLVAATTVGVTLYQRRSWAFFWLNAGYFLVVMTIGSLIIGASRGY